MFGELPQSISLWLLVVAAGVGALMFWRRARN
jgi:hypothetical protein